MSTPAGASLWTSYASAQPLQRGVASSAALRPLFVIGADIATVTGYPQFVLLDETWPNGEVTPKAIIPLSGNDAEGEYVLMFETTSKIDRILSIRTVSAKTRTTRRTSTCGACQRSQTQAAGC